MRTVPGHLSLHTDKDFPWPPVTIHRQGCPRALVTTTCMDCPRTLVNTICTTIPGSLSLHTDKDCPRTLVTICMDCPRMPVTTIYKDFPRMPVTSHLVTCHYTQTRTVPGHLSLHTNKDCPWPPVSTHRQGLSLITCNYTQTRTVPGHLSLHTDKGFVIGEPHLGVRHPGGISAHRLTPSCSTLCGFLEPRFPLC